MNKLLLSFLMSIVCCGLSTPVQAQTDTYSYTFSGASFTASGSTQSLGGLDWELVTDPTDTYIQVDNDGLHLGSGSKTLQTATLSTSGLKDKIITSVSVNFRDANKSGVLTVKVGDKNFTCDNNTSVTGTNTATKYSFTGNGMGDIVISAARPASAQKAMYFKSIEIEYMDAAAGPVDFEGYETEITLYAGQTKSIFNQQILPAAYTFESKDTDVATVDDEGNVTGVAVGDTEIIFEWFDGETFKDDKVTIPVHIIKQPDYITATVVMSNQENLSYRKDTHITWVSEEDPNITFDTYATTEGTTYPQYNSNAGALRIYSSNGNKLYVSAPQGYYFDHVDPETGSTGSLTINGLRAGDSASSDDIHTFDGDEVFETEFMIESSTGNGEGKNTDIISLTFRLKPLGDQIDHTPVVLDWENSELQDEKLYTRHDNNDHVFHFYFQEVKNLQYHYNLTYEQLAPNPEENGEVSLMADDDMEFTPYDAENHITIPANTFGVMTYYAEHKATGIKSQIHTLAIDGGVTGVETIDIDAADSNVEYYNLQGVRVNNPANGLYILRQGNKVTKVIR